MQPFFRLPCTLSAMLDIFEQEISTLSAQYLQLKALEQYWKRLIRLIQFQSMLFYCYWTPNKGCQSYANKTANTNLLNYAVI